VTSEAVAAVAAAVAAIGSLIVAWLSYRRSGSWVRIYLRESHEGNPEPDLIIEASNSGQTPATVLRVDHMASRSRFLRLRRGRKFDGTWKFGGAGPEGNYVKQRLEANDATSWRIDPSAARASIAGLLRPQDRHLSAYMHLGSGRIVVSKQTLLVDSFRQHGH
jgi:hypothetical protein